MSKLTQAMIFVSGTGGCSTKFADPRRPISSPDQKAKIILYDLNGREAYSRNIFIDEGMNYFSIDNSEMAKGVYIMKLVGERNLASMKIIIN